MVKLKKALTNTGDLSILALRSNIRMGLKKIERIIKRKVIRYNSNHLESGVLMGMSKEEEKDDNKPRER